MKNTLNFTKFLAFLGATLVLLLSSCNGDGLGCVRGSGITVTEARSLNNFSQIDVQCDAIVNICEDSAYSFVAEGQSNILENLITHVSGGKLIIRNRRCVRGNSKLIITIHAPSVADIDLAGSANITLHKKANLKLSTSSFKISGSGNIEVVGTVETSNLYTKITGSGDLYLTTTAVWANTTITGSGKVEMRGTCTTHEIYITGSGKIHSFDLVTDDTYVNISGSGLAELWAEKTLDADITGSGKVHYKGWPKINMRISGSGSISNHN